jgi:hypothetical protein
MKVKLDENLGQSHAELVRNAGHVAQRVTEQGLSGAKDPKAREAVARVIRRVLAEHGLEPLAGCLAVADESSTRIRRPSPTEEDLSTVEEE